jgi:ABC-type oligopeptide transport system ATPase subunit
MASGEVKVIDLVKQFGDVTAVDGINLDMPGDGFLSILGPSRCDKTTTLRMIAGFEQPTLGQILLGGEDMAFTPPHKRNGDEIQALVQNTGDELLYKQGDPVRVELPAEALPHRHRRRADRRERGRRGRYRMMLPGDGPG